MEEGRIRTFQVRQTQAPFGENIPRVHRFDIALFDSSARPSVVPNLMVLPQELTPIPQMVGRPAPSAVYMNVNDQAYAKFLLDPRSFSFFKSNLHVTLSDYW